MDIFIWRWARRCLTFCTHRSKNNKCVLHVYNNNIVKTAIQTASLLLCLTVFVSKCEQLSSPNLFVCHSHIGCSRCPVWISFNVNLLSLSITFQLNVRATRAALPCLFLCALPEWTSTGYGNIGGLIWIIRQRSVLQVHINECFWHCKAQHQPADSCLHHHKACTHTTHATSHTLTHTHSCIYLYHDRDLIYVAYKIVYPIFPALGCDRRFSWTSVLIMLHLGWVTM